MQGKRNASWSKHEVLTKTEKDRDKPTRQANNQEQAPFEQLMV
jgi:hypothetical protein